MELTSLLSRVKYIGKNRADILAQKGLKTVRDLLNDFPYAYEDTTNIVSISQLYALWQTLPLWETVAQRFTLRGIVQSTSTFRSRRGMAIVKATIFNEGEDKKLEAVWFNQAYVATALRKGQEYLFFGKVAAIGGKLTLQAPRFEEVSETKESVHIGRITPLYHQVKGISSAYFRRFLVGIRDEARQITEFIPGDLLAEHVLESLPVSYEKVHFPTTMEDGEVGKKRLAIQELLELKTELAEQKNLHTKKKNSNMNALALSKKIAVHLGVFLPKLSFTLTKGQQNILEHILEKLADGAVMDTFVYGDVGSGKTIIALLLAYAYAQEGFSTILMAPTTILAGQHVETAKMLAIRLGLEPDLVIAVVSGVKKLDVSVPHVYIGTQAVLHNAALKKHNSVALVVIDEQHRFGVEQRQYLTTLPSRPHIITLSATPIPRTLALSFLGFSAAEFLNEKPSGRLPVTTKVVPDDKVADVYLWIKKRILDHNEQAFLVFPRIFVSEDESDRQSLLAMKKVLEDSYFADIPSGLLYGGMSAKEKEAVMLDFRTGKTKLLFSTTVVEVGVDVPQATVIAIHGADKYGMAQLHQLRGRVGRADKQSYCLLFTQNESEMVEQRLQFFSDHTDGIALAEYDLNHRGSGHLAGQVQSGVSDLRIADLSDLNSVQQATALFTELVARRCVIPRIIRVQSGDAE